MEGTENITTTQQEPLISIIIASYNSRNTIGDALYSITTQDMKDEIEVLIVDDCSEDPARDVIEKYGDDLNIVLLKTPYNGGPGNAKELGAIYATGKWMMFLDSDDELVPDVLLDNIETIKNANEFMIRFYFEEWVNGKMVKVMKEQSSWLHGKLYNRKFWEAHNIHFVKDLRTHEDTYIATLLNTICIPRQLGHRLIKTPLYKWKHRANSITTTRYEVDGREHGFLEVYFLDYLRSTSGAYKEEYLAGRLTDKEFIKTNLLAILLLEYFYMQSFYFEEGEHVITKNIDYARKELQEYKTLTGMSNKDIYNMAAANRAKIYADAYNTSLIGVKQYIPKYALEDWLDFLDKDEEKEEV